MGTEHRARPSAGPTARPRVGVPRSAHPLTAAIADLQREAGNRAVSAELAKGSTARIETLAGSVQRDVAAAPAAPSSIDDVKVLAGMWDSSVMARLAEAKEKLDKDPKVAYIILSHALAFVERAMDAVAPGDPTVTKLRIIGRSIDGIKSVLSDRMKGGGGATNVTDDLRSWYRESSDLGPELTVGPGGRTDLSKDKLVDLWNQGVVFPIGRTILKSGADKTDEASAELLDALEVLHMWRDGAPRGDVKLRLIALERAALFSYERLKQTAKGASEVDLAADLAVALQDAAVVGSLLAAAPQKQPPQPPPTPSNKPFVNDTELMKPGD